MIVFQSFLLEDYGVPSIEISNDESAEEVRAILEAAEAKR